MKASITAHTLDSFTTFSASRARLKSLLSTTSLKPPAIGVVVLFTLELVQHPVLFIEVKAPASFALDSQRKQPDDQMRDRFRDLRHNLVMPRLPGISPFGTRMAFYEYIAATNTLTPPAILPDPVSLNDVAPAERWSYDILEANGLPTVSFKYVR